MAIVEGHLLYISHNKADPSCGVVAIGNFPDLGPMTHQSTKKIAEIA